MSNHGMLGSLPLSQVTGPVGDLFEKLAGSEGAEWLAGLKRFLRKENPWPEDPAEVTQEVLAQSLILDCSQPLDISAMLGKSWSVWLGPADGNGKSGDPDVDPRADALAEVDFSQVMFENCLEPDESRITGNEKLRRLNEKPGILHGGRQFQVLWSDYQARGENSVLEHLRKTKGITYIDFFGLRLRGPDGGRYVLYLYWDGGHWGWDYYWLGLGWDDRRYSAVSPAS